MPDSLSWFSLNVPSCTHIYKRFNKNMDYGGAQESEINDSFMAVSVIPSCRPLTHMPVDS